MVFAMRGYMLIRRSICWRGLCALRKPRYTGRLRLLDARECLATLSHNVDSCTRRTLRFQRTLAAVLSWAVTLASARSLVYV